MNAFPEPYQRGICGERIELRDPEATPIYLETIARNLAQTCRWGAHCRPFYSVASHCLHVSDLLERTCGRAGAIVGLLHDAHEAYTGDCPSPRKRVLGAAWEAFERPWQRRVRRHFDLPAAGDRIWTWCKQVDLVALVTERAALCAGTPEPDSVYANLDAVHVDPQWSVERYEDLDGYRFLDRAAALGLG